MATDGQALCVAKQSRISFIGENGKKRFLVGDFASERVGDTDSACLISFYQRFALSGMGENVVEQDASVNQVDAAAAAHELRAVEFKLGWSADHRRHSGFFKALLQNFELAPGGDFAPIHNCNYWRRSGAAPFAVACEQSGEQAFDQWKLANSVVLGETLHHRQSAKYSGQSFSVTRAGGRFGIVFGELQGLGAQKGVQSRGRAGGVVSRRDTHEALFFRC